MNPPSASSPAQPDRLPSPPRPVWLGAALIILALGVAYANSFRGVLVLDDLQAIRDNPTLRHLAVALSPPAGGGTVSGRPLLNLTFALNYALSGTALWSYHAGNLLIHALAVLTLFGLVRRTLRSPRLAARFGPAADRLAGAIALLWALHPLQTESVTYVVQRAESLGGLWTLLTVYCFARSGDAPARTRWLVASAAACLLGVATKETVATAPLLVLLYDRTFVSGSFRAALERNYLLYHAFIVCWFLIGWQLIGNDVRGQTVGFGSSVSWTLYALEQVQAVAHYLWLTVLPSPQVLDYGAVIAFDPVLFTVGLVLGGAVVAGTVLALWRWPALGFAGAWFIVILAPTTSIIPVATQAMAEHRMYLPLAAVMTLLVLGLYTRCGRAAVWIWLALVLAASGLTIRRNQDYASPVALWTSCVEHSDNARARLNLGLALARAGRPAEAMDQFAAGQKLAPLNAEFDVRWGEILAGLGRMDEAQIHYAAALRLRPGYADAYLGLGRALEQLGRKDEALRAYAAGARGSPLHIQAHYQFGCALLRAGQPEQAAREFATVLRLDPQNPDAARELARARRTPAPPP